MMGRHVCGLTKSFLAFCSRPSRPAGSTVLLRATPTTFVRLASRVILYTMYDQRCGVGGFAAVVDAQRFMHWASTATLEIDTAKEAAGDCVSHTRLIPTSMAVSWLGLGESLGGYQVHVPCPSCSRSPRDSTKQPRSWHLETRGLTQVTGRTAHVPRLTSIPQVCRSFIILGGHRLVHNVIIPFPLPFCRYGSSPVSQRLGPCRCPSRGGSNSQARRWPGRAPPWRRPLSSCPPGEPAARRTQRSKLLP